MWSRMSRGDTVFLKTTHDVVDFAPKWRPLSDGRYVDERPPLLRLHAVLVE